MPIQNEQSLTIGELFSLRGKTALVTGGSSGLGYMMASGLLQNGARVYIASRSRERCDDAARTLSSFGECIPMAADVTDAVQRGALVKELTRREPGGISILVNNAGSNWGAAIADYPDAAFDKVLRTNVSSVFSLTRDLLELLGRSASPPDPSRVINIGSMDGLQVPIVQRVPTFAYSASKAALHHLTRTLAVELGPRNITVNAIAPGFFESKMTDYVMDNFREDIEDDCPLGRIGSPADIAGTLLYLASRAGAYTNGAIIPVDGGTHLSKGKREWQS
ncbi:MAG: SDR family oxidoreductase [Gammaproteobacteria bacterium]|nr:SDR family oxidoreductase [Gammaproteobacteria bacterium]MDP2139442.1 SDR family oxidoreductase [Gammaproteobacteria bacterium]MDP2346278.1 SDR family oxidoreductase [Gammaproteobacteria bacterium]